MVLFLRQLTMTAENSNFAYPVYLTPNEGFPFEFCSSEWGQKLELCSYQMVYKFYDVRICFDTSRQRDGQTDRQTDVQTEMPYHYGASY